MTRLAVLSDLHISPPGPLCSFHAGLQLAHLLDRLRPDHDVATLVLAGDIFDFLALPTATAVLVPEAVPGFVDGVFARLAALDWGQAIFAALGQLARHGTQLVVIPGNHDPELAHPEVADLLRARCGLPAGDRRLTVFLDGPWRTTLGRREIIVGHGHRGDPWNDIDPAMVLHHATVNPPQPLPLPLGSRLVVGAMRAFREKYAFVDALKPETPGVPLLLLYLDLPLALRHLPGVAGLQAAAVVASLQASLTGAPVLSYDAPGAPIGPVTDLRRLTDALFGGLPADERSDATIADIESWLLGYAPPAAGTLARHGGAGYVLRAALRHLSHDGTAFDRAALSKIDRAIIDEYLPLGTPRVVIAGHTHAAREHHPDADRTYLNTGTWSELLRWPPLGDDQAAREFIDALEAGTVRPEPHLTWALIDADRATLQG
ncbi:MAG TPA: metallophosphoesterase [Kofleriaceae bacterium]